MAKNTSFDVIVIGVGSMGSATCYYLSKRGYKVLGLEQFDITHELGSHAGQSRIIRKAYFEHPDYVPLLESAYKNWSSLEQETGEELYFKTGLLYAGTSSNEMIKGVKQSASLYNIELEKLDLANAANRFPQFTLPGNFEVLFEPEAGFITPEKAISLYALQAKQNGATININEKVITWKKDGANIIVTTDKSSYQCNKLIITAGAWAGKMIPGLAEIIKVTRQFVAWIKTKNDDQFELKKFPCWMIGDDLKQGCYYGFPLLDTEKFGEPAGLKLAHHFPFQKTDPDNVNRQTTQDDIENLKYCLNKYLSGVFDSILHTKICLYANSPDENFIIDKLPGYEENVSIACGFSGHGFKFASVIGEILADLAIEGRSDLPIEFLNAKRFV
ncbi:MAG TPA: N-methyl-L-tryptophan oxidase [Chitinophagaceae bacterium]|nr:N-methyl-L-tryptophan oxidase [Chitinophagaceae bacterium]